MNIENFYLIPFIIIFTLIYVLYFFISEKTFYKFVENHWFYRRNLLSKVSSILLLLGVTGLIVSLLDFRGKEEIVNSEANINKTIILIDSSLSMQAEDVRPNRFKRAILLAKHYVKNSVGEEISIDIFSDSVKKIIPFTQDVDLLDARLNAINSMNINKGGTSLTKAINESIEYLKASDGFYEGNLLVLTDAEETNKEMQLKVPDNVPVAIVGIGTLKGSSIPIRNKNNNLIGVKKHNGETVITKLDESFLKGLSNEIDKFKYWIGTSYTLPTHEIINFFAESNSGDEQEGQFRIKPVMSHYILIPSMILLIISFILKLRSPFLLSLLLLLTFNNSSGLRADELEGPTKTKKITTLENKVLKGDSTLSDLKELAQEYYKEGFVENAKNIYKEIIENEDDVEIDDEVNYITTLFENGEIREGIQRAQELKSKINDKQTQDELNQNIMKALIQQSEMSEEQKEGESNSSESEENEDNDDSESSGSNSNPDDSSDQSDNKNNSNGPQGDSNDQENKDDQKGHDDKDNSNKDQDKDNNQGDEQKDDQNDQDESNKDNLKKQSPKKNELPTLLKQLIQDDNNIQKRNMDTEIKSNDDEKKDW